MLSQNFKKVISILLIVSMTFTSGGFSVFASSVDDVVEGTESSGGEVAPKNYYFEYKEKQTVIMQTTVNKNLGEENDGNVDTQNLEEKNEDKNNLSSTTLVEKEQDEEQEKISDENNLNKNYPEEPEEEQSSEKENGEEDSVNNDAENQVKENDGTADEKEAVDTSSEKDNDSQLNEETETTEKSQVTEDENNKNDKTDNETNNNIETTETTIVETETTNATDASTVSTEQKEKDNSKVEDEEKEEGTSSEIVVSDDELDKVKDIKSTKNEIDFEEASESEANEVVVVKKYIYATRSIPEDSIWTIKEILANEASASFKTIPDTQVIKEKFLAKSIKVLLINQYGDEKVVEVPATWDVNFYSKLYFPEGYVAKEKEYEADVDGNLVIRDGEGNVEIKKSSLSEIDNSIGETQKNDVQEVDSENTADKEVTGFAGTEDSKKDEAENDSNDESDKSVLTADSNDYGNKADDEHDAAINNKEVVYEYEEVKDNEPIKADDEEMSKKNALLGNANTNVVTKETAKEEAAAILNMEELLKELVKTLGAPVKAELGDPYDVPIFGAQPTNHNHWVCGRSNCSDTQRNHFNENMDTKHSYTGTHYYQPISTFEDLKSALTKGNADSDYDFIYLTQDITITEMLPIYRQLFICLNQHTLHFDTNGQICTFFNYVDPKPEQAGTYPYGITFCGCETAGTANTTGGDFCGKLSGTSDRTAPAIFYTKSKGVYFYGLGNEGRVDESSSFEMNEKRLRVEGFKLQSSATDDHYRVQYAHKDYDASSDLYAYPSNPAYATAIGNVNNYSEERNSAFLTVSINGTDQAAVQTQTEAFFYALDIYDLEGNDGGFANLYYINSFAMEHCKIDSVSAFRGGVVSVDFNNKRYFDTSSGASPMNAYIDIGHNRVSNCGLGAMMQTGLHDNETWGTKGRYGNGDTAQTGNLSGTIKDDKVFSPSENGLFLIEGYDGGSTLQDYRIIRGNYFIDNNLRFNKDKEAAQAYILYISFDSQGANTTNIMDNGFVNNVGGAIYIDNIYNEKHGVDDAPQGTINFDNNSINHNQMSERDFTTMNRPIRRSIVNFESLSKVFINTGTSVNQQITMEWNKGIGSGAVSISKVDTVSIYKTAFKKNGDNFYAVSDGDGLFMHGIAGKHMSENQSGGGAIYLSSCSEVNIGHPTINQNYKVKFENNTIGTEGNGTGAGAIYAVDVKNLNISDVVFDGNQGIQGGAISMRGVNSDTSLNLYGVEFKNNKVTNYASSNSYKKRGGAIYYKGDDNKAYAHKFYTSYYLNTSNINKFNNNYVSKEITNDGAQIYLEKITANSDLKYANLTNAQSTSGTGSIWKSEIAVVDSTKRVAISDTTISANGTSESAYSDSLINESYRKAYSTIYVEDSELDLDEGTVIENNLNPIRLSGAVLSMVSYNFKNHAADGASADLVETEDDILVRNNCGDYVIGVDNDKTSNIYFKQGMFYNNTSLRGQTREGAASAMTEGDIIYDGMLGYIVKTSGAPMQSNIYLGGNVHIKNNQRTGGSNPTSLGNANIPIESAGLGAGDPGLASALNRHFNLLISKLEPSDFKDPVKMLELKEGVDDVRLGRNSKVILSPINNQSRTYGSNAKDDSDQDIAGTDPRADEIQLFTQSTDTATEYIRFNNQYIQGYDNGSGGAIPTSMFDTDTYRGRFNSLYDNRLIYFDIGPDSNPRNKVYITDKETLTDFAFQMIFPTTNPGDGSDWVQPIPNQRVRNGETLIRPIMDYALAENSTQAIYTSSNNYRVIDVAGNLETDPTHNPNPKLRFHSWNWAQEINSVSGTWNPNLFVIYANVNHEHRACGTPNDESCNHLGYTGNNHKSFGGDIFGDANARSKTCIDVRDPRQLFYMAEHPEYMYVLGADITIPEELDGLKTDGILNDVNAPLRGVSICLNGHTLTVANNKTFLALYDNCFITDCSTNLTGTIKYSDTSLTDVNIIEFVASNSILNGLNVNGASSDESKRLTFANLPINNTNQAFAHGLRDNEEVYLSRVAFKNNNVKSSILTTKGKAVLSDVDLVDNILNATGRSLLELKEAASSPVDIYVSGVNISSNSVISDNSSLLSVEANKLQSQINFQESENSSGDDIKVAYNKLSNRAAIHIGNSEEVTAQISFTDVLFEENYVRDDNSEKKGAALYLQNIYSNAVQFENTTFKNNGIDVFGGITNTQENNKYDSMQTNKLYGAGIYAENDKASTTIGDAVINISNSKFEGNVANLGGGIYFKNLTATNFANGVEFTANAASEGAAVYIDASDTSIAGRGSVSFDTPMIENNGAILVDKNNLDLLYKQDNVSSIDNNKKTGSVIYYSAIGNDPSGKPIVLTLENPTVKYNFAKDGVLKCGNANDSNHVIVTGVDTAEFTYNGLRYYGGTYYKYYGGPVVTFTNEVGYNPLLSLEADNSITTRIRWNFVEGRKAIENGLSNALASASMAFSGKVEIRDNFDSDNREANLRIRPSFAFDADQSLDPANTFVFFNSDITDKEMLITKWNYNESVFAMQPVLEHYYSDAYCPTDGFASAVNGNPGFVLSRAVWANNENDIIVYKGADTKVYVGAKKYATPIYSYDRLSNYDTTSETHGVNPSNDPTNTDERLALWGRKGDIINIDQYTKDGEFAYRVYNGFKKYDNRSEVDGTETIDLIKGNYYIGKTSDGEYKTWGFTNNSDGMAVSKYKVPKGDNVIDHFDYIYYIQHRDMHTYDVSAHGTFNNNFVSAYSNYFLYASYPDNNLAVNKNAPGVTSVDIRLQTDLVIDETLTKKVGLNICLGGHSISVKNGKSLARLDVNDAESQSLAILNCVEHSPYNAGILGGNAQTEPMFRLNGESNFQAEINPTLYIEGVRIQPYQYTGNVDGAIIKATYSNINIRRQNQSSNKIRTQVIGNTSSSFNNHSPFDLYNSRLSMSDTHIYGFGTVTGTATSALNVGRNGFFYLHGNDKYNDDNTGTEKHWNAIVGNADNVEIDNLYFESDKAFFNLEDVYGTSGVNESGTITFTNLETSGNACNGDMNRFKDTDATDADKYSGVNNVKSGALGGLFYINNPHEEGSSSRGLTVNNGELKLLRATARAGKGGVVYVEDFGHDLYNDYYNLIFTKAGFKHNEALEGGAIYFRTAGGYKARLSVTLNNSTEAYGKALNGNGGFIHLTQSAYNSSKPMKNKLAINSNDTSASPITTYIHGNTATGRGGAIYITDTIFTTSGSRNIEAGSTTYNTTDYNEAIEGGFLWQKRSTTRLSSILLEQNKSAEGGSSVYVDGSEIVSGEAISDTQMHDSLTFGVNGGLVQTYKNVSTSNKGFIVVGTYSDLIFDGTVKLWDGADKNNRSHVTDTHVLYVKGKNLNTVDLDILGVVRKIGTNFDYVNSFIYSLVEKKDRLLVGGFDLASHPHMTDNFGPALTRDPDENLAMSVYGSGEGANTNVHIGYVNAMFAFITFVKDNPGKAKILRSNATDPDSEYRYDAAIGSARSLGSAINMDTLKQAAVTASGRSDDTDFLGFVAYTSDSSGNNQKFKLYEPSDYIYPLNEQNYVIAVWKTDATNQTEIINTLNAYDSSDFGNGGYQDVPDFDHTNIRSNYTFASVESYEQLYLGVENIGYSLKKDIYDGWTELNTTINPSDGTYDVLATYTKGVGSPISSSEEVIYLNGNDLIKKNDTKFYENKEGRIIIFNKSGDASSVAKIKYEGTASNKIKYDFIKAKDVEIYAYSADRKMIDIDGFKFDLDSNAAFINQDIDDPESVLYLLGVRMNNTLNARIYAPSSGTTYMYGFQMGDENSNSVNAVELSSNAVVNDSLITFKAAKKVIIKGGAADDKYTYWANNKARNLLNVVGEYVNESDPSDPVFDISNIKFKDNGTHSGNLASKSMIFVDAMNSTEEQIVGFNNVSVDAQAETVTKGTETLYCYDSLFTSYGHRLTFKKVKVNGVTTNKYIIDQHKATGFNVLQFRMSGVELKGNKVKYASDGNSGYTNGVVVYQDHADDTEMDGLAQSINLIEDVIAEGNVSNAAFYNNGGAMNYTLGGKTSIKNNKDSHSIERNLVVHNSVNERQTVSFFNDEFGDMWTEGTSHILSSTSYIGVTATNWSGTTYKDIAYQTWTANAKDKNAIFNNIMHSDDTAYIVAKRGTGIILIKNDDTNLVKTVFDNKDKDATPIATPQYLYINDDNLTTADEPISPTTTKKKKDGSAISFIAWKDSKYLVDDYNFTDSNDKTVLEGEGTPKVATIYALWDRTIEMKIHTNNGGTGLDGGALSAVKISDGTNEYEVNDVVVHVPMGHPATDATKITFKAVGETTEREITGPIVDKPSFSRVGMNVLDIYTKNGWPESGKYGDTEKDWGKAWNWGTLEHADEDNVVEDMTLYVRWVGTSFKMSYNYYDYDEENPTISSGSTAVVNYYGGYKDSTVTQYYGSRMMEGTMFTPVRHGYKFINWHSSPSELFSDANIATPGTIYLWEGDTTMYAEWQPLDYKVKYVANDGEVQNENTGSTVGVATTYEATLKFDIGRSDNDPNFEMKDNRFYRNGYTLLGWNYDVPERGESGYITYKQKLGELNLLNSFIDTNLNPPVASPARADSTNYKPAELKPVWEANKYRLIFDFNDGSHGNHDTYKGTTYAATHSSLNPADIDDTLAGLEFDVAKDYFYIDVAYGSELSSNDQGIMSLPTPTRYGYTFDGWYTNKNSTGTEVTAASKYEWDNVSHNHDTGAWIKATDSRIYAKWKKNKYNLRFLAKDPSDDTVSGTIGGTIANIENIEFDTNGKYEIPAIRTVNASGEYEFKYQIAGYTYNGAYLVGTDPTNSNSIRVEIPNATKSVVISSTSSFRNLKLPQIEDGTTIDIIGSWQYHNYKIEYYTNKPAGTTVVGNEITTSSNIRYDDATQPIWMPSEAELAISGYKFIGWATKSVVSNDNEIIYKDGQSYAANRLASEKEGVIGDENDNKVYKLYAVWRKSPYTVEFSVGKNDSGRDITDNYSDLIRGSMESQTFETDGAAKKLASLSYVVAGHTFLYWKDSEHHDNYPSRPVINPNGQWKATYSDAELIDHNIRIGSNSIAVVAPFEGYWHEHHYKIVFDYGTPSSPKVGTSNNVVGHRLNKELSYTEEYTIEDNDPVLGRIMFPGYEFDCWTWVDSNNVTHTYRDGDDITRLAAEKVDNEEIVFKYNWIKKDVEITLDYNDGDGNDAAFITTFDDRYTSKNQFPAMARTGYTFDTWSKELATPYETVKESDKVTGNDIVRDVTFSYDSSGVYDPDGDVIGTLYAHWKHNNYTLTISAGEVTGVDGLVQKGTMSSTGLFTSSKIVRYERPIGEDCGTDGNKYFGQIKDLDTASLPGYTFVSYGEYNKNSIYDWVAGDDTITAEWNPITYNVAYKKGIPDTDSDPVEGNMSPTTNVTFDDAGRQFATVIENDLSSTFKRRGFTFNCWINENYDIETLHNVNSLAVRSRTYNNGDDIKNLTETKDKTVYVRASWSEHRYDIIYNSNAPTNTANIPNVVKGTMPNQTLLYTATSSLLANSYSVDGYTFKGWSRRPGNKSSQTIDFTNEQEVSRLAGSEYGTYGEGKSITLYAVWEANTYYVNFNLNDVTENKFGTTTASFIDNRNATEKAARGVITDHRQYQYKLTYDEPIGTDIGSVGNGHTVNNMKIKAGNRIGYDFIGWVATTSVADPTALRRSDRQINNELSTTLFRATHSITYYALWNNIKYDVNYFVNTKNYGAGAPTAHPTTGIVYFDCALGSDGELNATKSNISEIARVTGNQYAFQGWYYDQDWWLTDPDDPYSDILETASPSRLTRVTKDTVFDYNMYVYPKLVRQEGTDSRNIRITAYCAGLSQKLYVNPNGGTMWWGELNPNQPTAAGTHRTLEMSTEQRQYSLQVIKNQPINTTAISGVTFDDASFAGSLLPENTRADSDASPNPYTPASGYVSGDTHDPVWRKGYTFKGWWTTNVGAQLPDVEVKGTTNFWSDSQDAHIEAKWSARQYELKYDVNIPKYDDDGDGVYERDASTAARLEWIVPGSTIRQTTVPDNMVVTYGKVISPTLPGIATYCTPVLPGYRFDGWYLQRQINNVIVEERIDNVDFMWQYSEEDVDAGTLRCVDEPTGLEAIPLVLKAHWTPRRFDIVYHPNSGTSVVDADHPYGDDGDTAPSFLITGAQAGYNQVRFEGLQIATIPVTFDNMIRDGVSPGTAAVNNIPNFVANSRPGYSPQGIFVANGGWPASDSYDSATWGLQIAEDGSTRYDTDLIRDILPDGTILNTYDNWLAKGYVNAYVRWYPVEEEVVWDANVKSGTTVGYVADTDTTKSTHILHGDTFGIARTTDDIAEGWVRDPFNGIIYGYNEGTRRAGYELDIDDAAGKTGWNASSNGTGTWITTDTKAKDLVELTRPNGDKYRQVYAQWRPRKFGITFDANDAGTDSDHGSTYATNLPSNVNNIEFDSNIDAAVFATPSRPGYEFVGWYTSDGCNAGTWNGTWGTKVQAGMPYNFSESGALYSLDDTIKLNFENPAYSYSLVLYARWKPLTYKAKFHLNDMHVGKGSTEGKLTINGKAVTGSEPFELPVFFDHSVVISDYQNGMVRTNTELPVAGNLTRDGYSINTDNTWTLSDDGSNPVENIFRESVLYQVVGDTDYYANWTADQWTVAFSIIVNEKYKPHAGNNSMPHLSDEDTIDAVTPRTITFDGAGIDITEVTTLRSRSGGSINDVIGYNFDKWYLDNKLSDVYFDPNDPSHRTFELNQSVISRTDITIDKVMKRITLNPTFTEKKYKIVFNSNFTSYEGGTGTAEYDQPEIIASYNEVLTIPDPAMHGYGDLMAQNGFDFTGWSLSPIALAAGTLPEYPVGSSQDVTVLRLGTDDDTIILYAHWRKERFNIRYENNLKDKAWEDVTVGPVPTWYDGNGTEDNLALPAVGDENVPKLAGAEFKGWTYTFYYTKDFTGDIATTSTVTTSIDKTIMNPANGFSLLITANWKIITGQLIVDPNGGIGKSVVVDLDELDMTVSIPAVSFEFNDMTLDHFSPDPNDKSSHVIPVGGEIRIVRTDLNDNYYVYAIWKKNNNSDKDTGTSFYEGGKTSVGNRSYRSGSSGSSGGGGGGGGGGGRAIARDLTESNFLSTEDALAEGANKLALSLALPTGVVKTSTNGNWKYDPIKETWHYIVPFNKLQVQVGSSNLEAGLQLVAAGGLYTLPTGVGNEVAVYLFDNAGNMLTGMHIVEGNIYYFAPTGEMQFGWQKVNELPMYFDQVTGRLTI